MPVPPTIATVMFFAPISPRLYFYSLFYYQIKYWMPTIIVWRFCRPSFVYSPVGVTKTSNRFWIFCARVITLSRGKNYSFLLSATQQHQGRGPRQPRRRRQNGRPFTLSTFLSRTFFGTFYSDVKHVLSNCRPLGVFHAGSVDSLIGV